MKIENKVAVITGAGSGIGQATALELAKRGVRGMALADMSPNVKEVAQQINEAARAQIAVPFVGNTTDGNFRRSVYEQIQQKYGVPSVCVPAAGITRDALAIKFDKTTGKLVMYPEELFRQVLEVNLLAPVYWAMEMVYRVAEDRLKRGLKQWQPGEDVQGAAVFIGSVSSQGNKGQIAYAATKRGLEGAAATLMKEALYYGVRCTVIHPGFTNTPMVAKLGKEYIEKYILPQTQLHRLIEPEEIANAICFMITNSAVSGELWADAGWAPAV